MDHEYLKASDGTGVAVLAHVTAARAPLATVIVVDSVDNWPEKFIATYGTLGANGYITAASAREFRGHLDAGTIIIDSFAPGFTDDGTAENQVVMIKQTTSWADQVAAAAEEMQDFVDQQGDWRGVGAATASVASGYNKGSKEFVVRIPNLDLRNTVPVGSRFQVTRNTVLPAYVSCDFEASANQFASDASVAGHTFTDDFTVEANLYVESSPYGSDVIFAARSDGNSGWWFGINGNGQIVLNGHNGAAGNFTRVVSYESIPVGRWVHVAAKLDMSTAGVSETTSQIYIDTEPVASYKVSSGTNPTSIINTGTLYIGRGASAVYYDGRATDFRIWSNLRTTLQIQDNAYQQLTGGETGLVGYYKLTSDLNDSSVNLNHLTNSGVVTGYADNPWSTIQYGIVQSVTYTLPDSYITLHGGQKHMIPNMTLNTPRFSVADTPFGWPKEKGIWRQEVIFRGNNAETINTAAWGGGNTNRIKIHPGKWKIGWSGNGEVYAPTAGNLDCAMVMASAIPSGSASDKPDYNTLFLRNFIPVSYNYCPMPGAYHESPSAIEIAATTTYSMYARQQNGGGAANINWQGNYGSFIMFAENDYA